MSDRALVGWLVVIFFSGLASVTLAYRGDSPWAPRRITIEIECPREMVEACKRAADAAAAEIRK